MINHPLTYRVAATFAGTAAFAYLATAAAYARRLKRLLAKEEGMAEAMLAETAGAGAAQKEEETIRALQASASRDGGGAGGCLGGGEGRWL